MLRAFFLITIISMTLSSCEGQPKKIKAETASVVFINDTENQKVDVNLNGSLFTSYHYQSKLP